MGQIKVILTESQYNNLLTESSKVSTDNVVVFVNDVSGMVEQHNKEYNPPITMHFSTFYDHDFGDPRNYIENVGQAFKKGYWVFGFTGSVGSYIRDNGMTINSNRTTMGGVAIKLDRSFWNENFKKKVLKFMNSVAKEIPKNKLGGYDLSFLVFYKDRILDKIEEIISASKV